MQAPLIELTYTWDTDDYGCGRNFGHLAFEVDNIYETCQKLLDAGVLINRPPRDGRMAFVRSPDMISIEFLQKGEPLVPAEPWLSMENTGELVRTKQDGVIYLVGRFSRWFKGSSSKEMIGTVLKSPSRLGKFHLKENSAW